VTDNPGGDGDNHGDNVDNWWWHNWWWSSDNHEGPNEGHHFSPNFFNSADEMIHMTKQLTELKSYELSTRYQTSTVDKDLGQDPCQILINQLLIRPREICIT
jgi:hypothetical protein